MQQIVFAFVMLLAAAHVQAQSPGEISFWESVRNSQHPDELRAYLQQYPNGTFKALAESRLRALERGAPAAPRPATPAAAPAASAAPAVASFAPSKVTNETRMPRAGDTWVYRLSYPRIRGQWGQRTRPPSMLVVKVGEAGTDNIVDQVAVDGGTPSQTAHSNGAYLTLQGTSVFSPYLVAFRDLQPRASLGTVAILDPGCTARYICDASARVIGEEKIQVPAGTFTAIKVAVDHSWRASSSGSGAAGLAGMNGGRTVMVWYVPELKRAAKVQSRITVGDVPPVETTFDLELVSYQLK